MPIIIFEFSTVTCPLQPWFIGTYAPVLSPYSSNIIKLIYHEQWSYDFSSEQFITLTFLAEIIIQ